MGICLTGMNKVAVLSDASISQYININTLFGVVVILAFLLLIALGYLINIRAHLTKNTNAKTSQLDLVDNAIAQIYEKEQEELVSNSELVAVITAAIHASLGENAISGGFVVRSIRKAK